MVSVYVSDRAKFLAAILAIFVFAGAASSQVDNCCFVDRECTTDDEWVSGYYAYQNNECAAPPQQSQATGNQNEARSYYVPPPQTSNTPPPEFPAGRGPEHNSETVTRALNAILQSPGFVDAPLSLDSGLRFLS